MFKRRLIFFKAWLVTNISNSSALMIVLELKITMVIYS